MIVSSVDNDKPVWSPAAAREQIQAQGNDLGF